MFSRLRTHFGTAGLLVAVVALVAALAGGAVAANNSGGKATASAKKKPKPQRGKPGKPGKNGKDGAAGPAGPAGPAGNNGTNGTNGVSVRGVAATVGECANGGVKYTSASGDNTVCNGARGADGDSVTGEEILGGGDCDVQTGGTGVTGYRYTLDGVPTDICNGARGARGDRGDPWTAGGTLPGGANPATMTGTWAFGSEPDALTGFAQSAMAPISFPIPLAGELGSPGCVPNEAEDAYVGPCRVHYINTGGNEVLIGEEGPVEVEPVDCGDALSPVGTAANPRAASGHLCVYETQVLNGSPFGAPYIRKASSSVGLGTDGAGTTGAILHFFSTAARAQGHGSWAVTG